MNLSLSERSRFYDELGKLLTAGFPFLRSIETMLSARPRSTTRRILKKFQSYALDDANITESFSAYGMPFSEMEVALISACERSGQMQRGCDFLSRYYAQLDAVRGQIIRKALYPFFMLHFGIVLLSVPRFFQGGSPPEILADIAWQLGSFYFVSFGLLILSRMIIKLAVHSTTLDGLLGMLPLFGGIRRSLALSRFCTTYQMQLDAGVNVMDSLDTAARASASARIARGIRRTLPQIRAGEAVGPELAKLDVLPSELVRSLVIGEQTGSLDTELLRSASEYEAKALRGIEAVGDWMPKIIYLIIVGFLAWNIISAAKESTRKLQQIMDTGS
ncbi:MAG TPA: type II secretion system F family protein [Chthoniobacterales bacterium]|jgi:type IV pilus assembly protein PilC